MAGLGIWIERTPDWSIHVRSGGSSQMYDFSATTQEGRAALAAFNLMTSRPPSGVGRQLMAYERPDAFRSPFLQYPAWSPRTQALLRK